MEIAILQDEYLVTVFDFDNCLLSLVDYIFSSAWSSVSRGQ